MNIHTFIYCQWKNNCAIFVTKSQDKKWIFTALLTTMPGPRPDYKALG